MAKHHLFVGGAAYLFEYSQGGNSFRLGAGPALDEWLGWVPK